jgi:coniferyl-aldehyde dehydrogenase
MEKRVQKRLSIDEAKEKGATLIPLAKINSDQSKKKRKIPLTILLNGTDDMTIMREEIFGPVLPVIPVKSMNDAINYVNAHPTHIK